MKKMYNNFTILMYHDIESKIQDWNRYSPEDFIYTLKRDQFKAQLNWLAENNYETLSLNAINSFFDNSPALKKKIYRHYF